MLKRFMSYVLCFVMLATALPFEVLSETVNDVPVVTTEQPAESNVPLEEAPPEKEVVTQAPATEKPTEKPVVTAKPTAETATEKPAQEEQPPPRPVNQEPAVSEPAKETPAQEEQADEPARGTPAPEVPAAEEPEPKDPVIEEPFEEPPVSEEADAEVTAGETPTPETPAFEEPENTPPSGEPASEEPPVDEPETEEPLQGDPNAETPGSDEPADEPAKDEPAPEATVTETPLETEAPPTENPPEEFTAFFTPQNASWDLAAPGNDLVIILLDGAPAFDGIEGLKQDREFSVRGKEIILSSTYLNTLPVGQTVLSLLFEGELRRDFYLNIANSGEISAQETPEESAPSSVEPPAGESGEATPPDGEPVVEDPLTEEPPAGESGETLPPEEEPIAEEPLPDAVSFLSTNSVSWDLAAPGVDPVIIISEEAPAFLSVEGLTPDTDYLVSGLQVTLTASYLNALPVGETALSFLFEGGLVQVLNLSVSDSSVLPEEEPLPEEAPEMSLMAMQAQDAGPIVLDSSSLEKTVYLNGYTGYGHVGTVWITGDLGSYSTLSWTLTDFSGSSLSNLHISASSDSYATVSYDSLVSSGVYSALLTCTVDAYSQSIPVTVTVSSASVPDDFTAPEIYSGTVNQSISIPRPSMIPAGTDLPGSSFEFNVYNYDAVITGDSASGYELTFDTAGYYNASLVMECGNVYYGRDITIKVADETGHVPGNVIIFLEPSSESTVYINTPEGIGKELNSVYLLNDVSAYGDPVWTLSGISGSAVSGLDIYSSNGYSAVLEYDSLQGAGVTNATLTCTVGAYTASIPVKITVSSATTPQSIQTPTSYQGKINVPLVIERPVMAPSGTDIPDSAFVFDVYIADKFYADGGTKTGSSETGFELLFPQAGYYPGNVIMYTENLYYTQSFVVGIEDANGQVPGNPLTFAQTEVNNTYYLNADSSDTYSFWVAFKDYLYDYGEPEVTLSGFSGMTLSNLKGEADIYDCLVSFDRPSSAGTSQFTLTASLDAFTYSIPVTLVFSDAAAPESMQTQKVYDGQVNIPFTVPRATLLPEGTGLNEDLFNFYLNQYDGVKTGDSASGYQITFDQPGIYRGTVTMSYANFYLYEEVVFIVRDESGGLPDSPVAFNLEERTFTYLLRGDSGPYLEAFWLQNDVTLFGTPQAYFSDINGASVSGLHVNSVDSYVVWIQIDRLVSPGITTATLNIESGDYSDTLLLTFDVQDKAVPTSLDMPDEIVGSVGEYITVARPGLVPSDTGMSGSEFEFYLYAQGVAEKEETSGGYEVMFTEPGYYSANAIMNYANIRLSKTFRFAIKDQNGQVPFNLIDFSWDSIEEEVYLGGNAGLYTYTINQWDDVSSFGESSWSLRVDSGDSVSGMGIEVFSDPNTCELKLGRIVKEGVTTATLTFTVGEHSKSIPIKVTVLGGSIPQSMETPSQYDGVINVPVTIARPVMQPPGTGVNGESFYFGFDYIEGTVSGGPDTEYQIVFDEPGIYPGRVYMVYSNIYFEQEILFRITDENGQIPNTQVQFEEESRALTYYLGGTRGSEGVFLPFQKDISHLGDEVITLSNVQGDAVIGLSADSNWGYGVLFRFDSIRSAGTTTATVTCEAGGFWDTIDISITVLDVPVPDTIDIPDQIEGKAGESILMPFPSLLPADTGIDPSLFTFDLAAPYEVDITSYGTGYRIDCDTPGYYAATASMYYMNIRLRKPFLLAIKDNDGQVPGSPISLSEAGVERTFYLKGEGEYDNIFHVFQNSDLSVLGEGVWSLKNITGDSVNGMVIRYADPSFCGIRIGDMQKSGVTSATLVYTVGGFSEEIPITVTVIDTPVPTGLNMPITYKGTIGVPFNIPAPSLSPIVPGFSISDFELSLHASADVQRADNGGLDVTFWEAGYKTGNFIAEYSNIELRKALAFEIKDESGVVPGVRLEFAEPKFEETYYFTGKPEIIGVWIRLKSNPLPYGTPVYTIAVNSGTSVGQFELEPNADAQYLDLYMTIKGYGDTRATLTVKAGAYTATLPMLFHIPQVVLPTGLDMPIIYTGMVDEDVAVSRPSFLPADTPLSPDDFWFDIGILYPDGSIEYPGWPSDDMSSVIMRFDEPGYYKAQAYLNQGNLNLTKTIYYQITDKTGVVPGNPYSFSRSEINKTIYLNGTDTHIDYISLDKKMPDLGTGIWSLRKLDADTPTLRSSVWNREDGLYESYDLWVEKDSLTEGVYNYEVVCVFDGISTVIPLTLTVTSLTPASISLPQTVFTYKVNEWFTLPQPVFDPGDTGINGLTLNTSVSGNELFWDNVEEDSNGRMRMTSPGYYSASVYMYDDENNFFVDVFLIINNVDNTPPPGSPVEFRLESDSLIIFHNFQTEVRKYFQLENQVEGLGTPQITVTPMSGDAVVASLEGDFNDSYGAYVKFMALRDTGSASFLITYTAGVYTDSVTVNVEVSNATLPKDFAPVQTEFSILTNQTLTFARPELVPTGTDISQNSYKYSFWYDEAYPLTMITDTEAEKVISFSEPGLYTVQLNMSYLTNYLYRNINITVSEEGSPPPAIIPITAIDFFKTSYLLEPGQSVYLNTEVQPANPSFPEVDFVSDNPLVVSYNSRTGYITAHSPGTAIITAMARDGSGVTATCTVTVPDITYDMSAVKWSETTSFAYDGQEKKVFLTGLPSGVFAAYTGASAKDIGTYTASVVLTYANPSFVGPVIPDLAWEIIGPVVPVRAAPKIAKVEAISATSLKLTWGRVAGATGYNIYVSARPNDSYTYLTSTTALALTISRLKAGTRYFYKIETYDLIGGTKFTSSPMSVWAAGVPLARPAITSITSPAARQIKLTWSKSAGAGGWQVMFATSAKGPWKVVRTVFVTSASFTGLKSGSTFYFKIRPYRKYYAFAYFGPESPVKAIKVK